MHRKITTKFKKLSLVLWLTKREINLLFIYRNIVKVLPMGTPLIATHGIVTLTVSSHGVPSPKSKVTRGQSMQSQQLRALAT
jgi:hypothetical protein